MATALKIIFRILIILIFTFALLIGAVWGFCYFKYHVNLFSIIGTVNTLNEQVDTQALAPKQITDEDTESLVSAVNTSFPNLIKKDSSNNYYVNKDAITPVMLGDLKLTDKQVCALTKILINSNDVKLNIGGQNVNLKDYGFELLQIAFSDFDAEAKTLKLNVVASISMEKFKEKLNSFPLSIFKSRIPETLYISSTVVVGKTTGVMSYTVENSSLRLNNVENDKVEELCTLANNFISIGTASELNQTIGTNFVNAIIGTDTSQGFVYTLVDKTTALDFDFTKESDEIKLVVKNSI